MKLRHGSKKEYRTKSRTLYKSKNVFLIVAALLSRYTRIGLRNMLLSRLFNLSIKTGLVGMITFSALYGAYALIGTNVAKDVIVSKSEIINRVGTLTELPKSAPEAVVRVGDPTTLRKQNAFYDGIKEGDYIVVYPSLAVIYDLRNNVIVGLKRSR